MRGITVFLASIQHETFSCQVFFNPCKTASLLLFLCPSNFFFDFHNCHSWECELAFPPLCPLFVFFWLFCLRLLGALHHSSIQSVERRVQQENTSAKVAEWLCRRVEVCKMHQVWVWRRVVWQRQRIALPYFRCGLVLGLRKWCSSLVLLVGRWIVMKKFTNLDFH